MCVAEHSHVERAYGAITALYLLPSHKGSRLHQCGKFVAKAQVFSCVVLWREALMVGKKN